MIMSPLSQALGVYRLHLRVMRNNAIAYAIIGVLIPLIYFRILLPTLPPEQQLRLLVGHVVFSALMMGPRQGVNLVRLRMYGQERLLDAFGVDYKTALAANALYVLSMAPLSLLVCGVGVWLAKLPGPANAAFLLPLVVTFVALAGVAYTISGTSTSVAGATMKNNLFVIASVAFCPLFYPLERVPDALRWLVRVLPQSLCTDAMTAAWRGEPGLATPLVVLGAWAVGLLALGFALEARQRAVSTR